MSDLFTLYERLGIPKTATLSQIKAAHCRLSKEFHPDMGEGNENLFQQVQHAYKILMDPDRKERYDRTGRDDDIKVTPKVIQDMVENTVVAMVIAERPDGTQDDPRWEDVRSKMAGGIRRGRVEIQQNLKKAKRNLTRLEELAKRFKSKTDADPIGDAFAAQRLKITTELYKWQDAFELNCKTEEVFLTYDYVTGEMEPEPEGRFNPDSTRRLGGPRYLPSC